MNATRNTLTSTFSPYNRRIRSRVENNVVSSIKIHSNNRTVRPQATRLLGEGSAHYRDLQLLKRLVTAGLPLNSHPGALNGCHLYLVIPNPRRKPDVSHLHAMGGRLGC